MAEYRFWVPCGRRTCAFGCGGAHEGESAAAKKLFKDVASVVQSTAADEEYDSGVDGGRFGDVQAEKSRQQRQFKFGSKSPTKPADEWKNFLKNKERDVSVARV